MHTAKIAALYASPIFNTLLRFPDFDRSTTLTEQVTYEVLDQARVVSEDGRCYRLQAARPYSREKHFSDAGFQVNGFLQEHCTKRQADWVLRQLPAWPEQEIAHLRKGLPQQDTYLVDVWGHGQEDTDTETLCCLRYGAREDFEVLLRGMAAIRAKRRKQARKLEAQLRAYHRQQLAARELHNLQRGHWLGDEQALTTAARTDDPTVAYLGDAGLSPEQCRALGLHYWRVPEGAGMSAAFPAGTGLALKVLTSHKQLLDGAVYLSQVTFGKHGEHPSHLMRLGRLDKSRKQYGMIPLFHDDAPGKDLHVQAEWKPATPEQGYEVLLMQVVYYTTRAATPAALLAPMVAETQPARQQPATRKQRRELVLAA